MRLKTLLVVNAAVDLIFGIGLVLMPGFVLGLFVQMPMYNLLGSQLLGTNMIGYAALNFLARNAEEGDALLQPILVANLASNGIGFVLALLAQLGGTATMLNWFTVVLPLVFTLSFAYYLVRRMRPGVSLASTQQ